MGSPGERSHRGFSPAPGWHDPPGHPQLPAAMNRVPRHGGGAALGAGGRLASRNPRPAHLPAQSKEKMKEGKEKVTMTVKEGKDKDARYTNGHLFSTITVSGTTMCFACNKSITAKEALSCPSEPRAP